MSDVGVIDTGVLIGFSIKNDQHHETTKEYILNNGPDTLYIPPRAKTEYDNIESHIRNQFRHEVIQHRQNVSSRFNSQKVTQNGFQYIRDQILNESNQERVHAFLYRWYTNLYKQNVTLKKSTVIRRLSNIETEVMKDRSQKWGGWKSHINVWAKGTDSYPSIKSNLLLSDQPDLDILLEAHHISTQQVQKQVEFGTANPQDFKYKNDGEPKKREDDIKDKTDLDHIEDLSHQLTRHFP